MQLPVRPNHQGDAWKNTRSGGTQATGNTIWASQVRQIALPALQLLSGNKHFQTVEQRHTLAREPELLPK